MNQFNKHFFGMRIAAVTLLALMMSLCALGQSSKIKNKKYPSLLWEVTKKGSQRPSYLFGTMHVSSKMVFHLSDSFYLGLKNADVVALENNPGNWQEDFSRYNLDGPGSFNMRIQGRGYGQSDQQDYLSINRFKAIPYEKLLELALSSNPAMINNFLYRNSEYGSADFEEDTYLDLYIYQVGRKWNKKIAGVERFDESMRLMREAYADAAKDKKARQRSYDVDNEFSYAKLEEAYRTGNLDLLDTIHKLNSQSAAFDEKFLYRRNEIQAASIDSIIQSGATLFVGVGAAHLPGERGVIELLRRKGYRLRPIKMTERDGRHKEQIEQARVQVPFAVQSAEDGLFTVSTPGKLYGFGRQTGLLDQKQYADMANGSYYVVTRLVTNAGLWGHSSKTVLRKLDSVLYENVPGKIISKKPIVRGGYHGFDVLNKTRRGDYQRYHIFVTPFEVLLFKMSGNGEYVRLGKEAEQFFNSIQLKSYSGEWKKYTPPFGGFSVQMPEPFLARQWENWKFMGTDAANATHYTIARADVHNLRFAEEDSFDLNLMEESFAASECVQRQLQRSFTRQQGYTALDAKYKYKDSSIALVRMLIKGPHYYLLVANSATENERMKQFIQSFSLQPFVYPAARQQTDTSLNYTVSSPVLLEQPKKLEMYPEELYRGGGYTDDDAALAEYGTYKEKTVANDSTGEKIFVSFYKPGRYYFDTDTTANTTDSTQFKTSIQTWRYRSHRRYELPNKTKVLEYELTDSLSSRMVKGKLFSRDGVDYRLETYLDTLSQPGSFVQQFFTTFVPADTIKGTNPKQRKAALYFADFFSSDTVLHKKAVKNMAEMQFDSTDLPQLKRMMATLNWKEKKYLDVKTQLVSKLASVPAKTVSDWLKEIYFAAVDTMDIQHAALEALLRQQTAYSYNLFKDIMLTEPPVLNLSSGNRSGSEFQHVFRRDDDEDYANGAFLDELYDSLALTKTIIKDLLPLSSLDDYEGPMMRLLETMVDSSLVTAKDYEFYLPRFLLEARQEMKKQVISEKNKSIEKAQQEAEEKEQEAYGQDRDNGNHKLSAYATLLMPFWESNIQVQQLLHQMLASNDKKLRYNTAMLFVRNGKALPDSVLQAIAASDEYRFNLYRDLRQFNQSQLFPARYNNHLDLAKSDLLATAGTYRRPDTLVYLKKLPAAYKGRKGFVYFFKYKFKKDDQGWKLAMAGLTPENENLYLMEASKPTGRRNDYDFTTLTNTRIDEEEPLDAQLWKALKKQLYSRRNSAAGFYGDEEGYDEVFPAGNFRD